MDDIVNVFAIVIAAAIAIPIVLLLSAVLLRAAVSLYNRFAGGSESPRGIAVPSMGKAVGIVLVIGVVNWVIGLGVELIAGLSGAEWLAGMELATYGPAAVVTFFPLFVLEFIAGALVLAWLLPTRFVRAVGVSVCHTGICIAVALVAIGAGMAGAALIGALV